jgi:hypothetical protein
VLLAPAFTRQGHHRVHVDQVAHRVGATRQQAVGDAGDDLAAIAVTHEHDALQFFGIDKAQHIGDVGLQPDVRAAQMGAFAIACERDGVHLVPGRAQRGEHAAPDPGAAPGTVNQDEGGQAHGRFSANHKPATLSPAGTAGRGG